jgi:fluoride exporter
MRRLAVVFLGGGLGASLRAIMLAWLSPAGASFPVLLINLLGAFALGVVFVLADEAGILGTEARFFLAVGVLGGFTTFSTFGWGTDLLVAHHAADQAVEYVVASVGGGVAAVAAGLAAGRELMTLLERTAMAILARLEERGMRRGADARTTMSVIKAKDREESA